MLKNAILIISSLAVISPYAEAQQKNKKEKKTSITIVTEEDGKKTVVDTVFINADQETIDAFVNSHGSKPPAPPKPPVPPKPMAPGAPATPPPPPDAPSPPDKNRDADDESGFYFHFDMPDFDTAFEIDMKKEMDDMREAIDKAKIDMRISLDKAKMSREDLKQLMKEIEEELDNIEMESEKSGRTRKVIIRKKTSEATHDRDERTGYIYNWDQPMAYAYSFPREGSSFDTYSHFSGTSRPFCTTAIVTEKKESGVKRFLNRVVDKILE
jgi:hypothetical protein